MTACKARCSNGGEEMGAARDAKIAQLTIGEILTEFLAEQRERLSTKTFARYREVIGLFTSSLNNYACQGLSQGDAELFNRLNDAQGDERREFCEIFGPDQILSNVREFLGYFMIRKVIAGPELKRAAGTMTKALARWLAQKGYVTEEAAANGAAEGARAARNLPTVEALARRLMEYAERNRPSIENDQDALEDHFTIHRVEPGQIWLEAMDGNEIGPIALPPALARQCKVGWEIAGTVGRTRHKWKLLEVWNVYPN